MASSGFDAVSRDSTAKSVWLPDVGVSSLTRELPQVISEPVFHYPRFVKALRHQCSNSLLRRGSTERSDARIPPRAEFDIRWQAGVDEALGVGDCPFVEPGDPGRKCLYERVQLRVRQRAIYVAVGLSLVRPDVV